MSSHGSFASTSRRYPGSALESPVVQSWESPDSPRTNDALTVSGSTSAHHRGGSRRSFGHVAGPYVSPTRWSSTNPYEFVSSRITRPRCASTAELFGHLSSYRPQHVQPPPQEEEDDGNDGYYTEGTSTQDIPSPLRKRQRRKLRGSAGVRPKPSKKRTAGPSAPKTKTSLPPAGRMRCLWGDGCTVRMAFDYTLDTIKDWKIHVASHLTKPDGPIRDSVGGQKVRMVACGWGGCSAEVERGYLFKHIVTHEVRFKLLCPYGCEVAIRDDNLDRHLRSCRRNNEC